MIELDLKRKIGSNNTIKLQKNTHLAPTILVKYPNGTRSTEPKITGIAKMTDICPGEISTSYEINGINGEMILHAIKPATKLNVCNVS